MGCKKIVVKVDSELEEIVPGFIDRRKREVPSMWESLRNRDFSALQTLGHRLRGNAGGYGFDAMGSLGAAIESNAKAQDAVQMECALKELEDYLSRLEVVFEAAA